MNERSRNLIKMLSFDIIKLPENVRKFAKKIIVLSILGIFIPDLLSFSLKGSQICIENNYPIIAFVLIIIHFGNNILGSIYNTWYDLQNDNYEKLTTSESTKIILKLTNDTKSKVFKKKENISQMLETSEIIDVVRNYQQDYWALYLKVPTTIAQVIMLIITLIISIVLEIMTSTFLESCLITVFLVIGMILFTILSKKKIAVFRKFRETTKNNDIEESRLLTEIKNTDFISQKDFSYHAFKLIKKLDDNIIVRRSEHLKINHIFVLRNIVASIMMIIIILIKLFNSEEFSINSLFDIIAVSSIYSSMLQRISSITNNYENIMNIVVDVETLFEDFKNINDVYEAEQKKIVVSTPVESLFVSKFSVTQDINGAFELINNHSFSLKSGDTVMSYGKTGCGKSTLINMFTGRIFLPESPIQFSNGKNGYLNSIGYQTDKAMANNFVLNEIALTDDYDTIDQNKLLEIIKGLNLYREILRIVKEENLSFDDLADDQKIFELLKIRKTKEFSSGQMQRLALAKLLYSLDDSIQLVALDEPFNRLDDKTCKDCIDFVTSFVHRKKRILLIATHQVEICKEFCNVEISFGENLSESIISVKKR